jgi:hypothetical protein
MSCHWYNCLNAIKGDVQQGINKVTGNNPPPSPMKFSGGPQVPTNGNTSSPFSPAPTSGVQNGMQQGAVPTGQTSSNIDWGGIWDKVKGIGGPIVGMIEKFLPHDSHGSIDWGKLAGTAAVGYGAYTQYEGAKAQNEYYNKLLDMKTNQINRSNADWDSRAGVRKQTQDTVMSHVGNIGKDIFTPYLGGK